MNVNDTNHKQLKAVFFDLGSTLIYFDGEWPSVLRQTHLVLIESLQQAGLNLNTEKFLKAVDERFELYWRDRNVDCIEYSQDNILHTLLAEWGYRDVQDSILKSAIKAMFAVSEAHWHVEDDAHQTLNALREQGYYLGIISNASDDPNVQRLIDNARLRPYFEFIISSAAFGLRKPHPRIFEHALNQFDLLPVQAVMVGDMLSADIIGANNLGMHSIWITRRANDPVDLAYKGEIVPAATVSSLAEIPALLKAWNKSVSV
jgi:HAD superfamily hydrolase (TIGR01662 family)